MTSFRIPRFTWRVPARMLSCVLGLGALLGPVRADTLRVGMSVEFEEPALVKEAFIAFRFILGEALSDSNLNVDLRQYDTFKLGLDALREGGIDATVVPGHLLAGLPEDQQNVISPELVIQRTQVPTERFLLLSRHGPNLADLQGRKLRMVNRRNRGITGYWLEAELRTAKAVASEQFFAEITDCSNSQDALLPAFFGKGDACVISEADYKLMSELNPQLGQKFSVVLTSPSVIPLILVSSRNCRVPGISKLWDRAVSVHERKEGQQVFTLLQLQKIGRFREEDFAGTRELVAFAQKSELHSN